MDKLFAEVNRLSAKYKGTVWRNFKDGSYYVIDVFGLDANEYDVLVGYRSTKNNNLLFSKFDDVFTVDFERVVY